MRFEFSTKSYDFQDKQQTRNIKIAIKKRERGIDTRSNSKLSRTYCSSRLQWGLLSSIRRPKESDPPPPMLTPSLYYSIVAVESLWLVNHVVENVRDALGEIVCLVPSASLGLKHGALDHAND